MSTRLAARLIGDGVLPEALVRAAAARQLVYGGSLDTVLLEMRAITEEALWGRLTVVTGLPAPRPALCDTANEDAASALAIDQSTRLGAVPVARRGDTVDVLCAEPVAEAEIRRALAARGLTAALYVVPEVRLLASRQKVYGEPVPGRFAPLLARLREVGEIRPRRRTPPAPPATGAAAATGGPPLDDVTTRATAAQTPLERVLDVVGPFSLETPFDAETDRAGDSWSYEVEALAPGTPPEGSADAAEAEEAGAQPMAAMPDDPLASPPELSIGSSAVPEPIEGAPAGRRGRGRGGGPREAATEALCRRARDPEDKGRPLALRALRGRRGHAAVRALIEELRRDLVGTAPDSTVRAAEALGELRDTAAIPALIELLVPASAPPAIAAQQALVALAAHDFGHSQRRWLAWWHRRSGQHRIEWLIEGMGHADMAIRAAAADELRQISGVSFEFGADLPKPEREKAQQWARAWWVESGRQRFGGRDGAGSL